MLKSVTRVLSAGLVSLCGASLEAQVCMGLPDNSVVPYNLGVGASFPDGAKSFGARFGAGNARGFGGVQGLYSSYDHISSTSGGVGVDAGLSVPLGQSTARLCPVAGLSYITGPKVLGVDLSTVAVEVGLRLGGTLAVNEGLSVLPFFGGSVLTLRQSASGYGESESANDTGGAVVAGFGLLFSRVFTVAPTITIPVGFETSDATFGIQASIGFGRR